MWSGKVVTQVAREVCIKHLKIGICLQVLAQGGWTGRQAMVNKNTLTDGGRERTIGFNSWNQRPLHELDAATHAS